MTSQTATSGDSKVKKNLGSGQLYVAFFAVIAAGLVIYDCHIPRMLPLSVTISFLIWLFVAISYLYFLFHDVKRYAWITPVLFVVTMVCAVQGPRVGFSMSQKQLDQIAKQVLTESTPNGKFEPPKKAGVYEILAYSIDANSGTVYLVTTYENDGLGPDTCTSGFVYKPVATESPYGRKYYDPLPMSGDWFQFSASNDF